METRIEELERVITHLDSLYEAGEDCIHPDTGLPVSDSEYDVLRKELAGLSPDSPVLESVTASMLESGVKKVKHDPPMTSISKAIGDLGERRRILFKWLKETMVELGYSDRKGHFVQSYKRDGVALSLVYKDGKLVSAGLRPRDGVNGEDVTANAKFVEGIPARLPEPITCTIRGELECRISVFEKINAELEARGDKTYANPRNFTAGSIRQFKDPKVTKERRLSFTAYRILGFDDAPYKTEIGMAKYCAKTLKIPFVQTRPFRVTDLAMMEENVPNLDYEVDGVVISVENLEDSEQLGTVGGSDTGNPKGKLAWKFAEEIAEPDVDKIDWRVGRTGDITPVMMFDAVRLAGTNVTQCTGHNLGFLQRKRITVGTKIQVIKSGKIIPKVVGVTSDAGDPCYPDVCPVCGGDTSVEKGGKDKETGEQLVKLVCPNVLCGARKANMICHYLTTLDVKGIGESAVQKLLDAGVVTSVADLYSIRVKKAREAGLSKREAILLVARIQGIDSPERTKENSKLLAAIKVARGNKTVVPAAKFVQALGVSGIGRSTAKALVSHFGEFANLRAASAEALEAVEDVGEKTARSLHDFFACNGDVIDGILEHVELEKPKTGIFTGKAFVFTGGFPGGKKTWEGKVEERGGKCSGSVSSKTDFVVVGTDAGAKAQKAASLGIKMIDVTELESMLV